MRADEKKFEPSWTCRFPSRTETVVAAWGDCNPAPPNKDARSSKSLTVGHPSRDKGCVLAAVKVFLERYVPATKSILHQCELTIVALQ
jgi:hypothetical protein